MALNRPGVSRCIQFRFESTFKISKSAAAAAAADVDDSTDTDALLKFKQQTCMNRPIQLTIR